MNGPAAEKLFESGNVVEIVHGPLSGIRGVLIRMTDDRKAILRLHGLEGVFLVVPAEHIVLPPNS